MFSVPFRRSSGCFAFVIRHSFLGLCLFSLLSLFSNAVIAITHRLEYAADRHGEEGQIGPAVEEIDLVALLAVDGNVLKSELCIIGIRK